MSEQKQQEWRKEPHWVLDNIVKSWQLIAGGLVINNLPERLVDAILRDHELAQSHSKGMTILAGEVHEARARIAELEAMTALAQPARLFDLLKHGDAEHQAWLSTALNAALSDRPVPEPSGKGRAEAAEADAARAWELVGEIAGLLEQRDQDGFTMTWAERNDWLARAEAALAAREVKPS